MGLITRDTTWETDDQVTADNLNGEFDTIHTLVNGNLSNTNIDAAAAIADTKLASLSSTGKVLDTALTEAAAGVVRGQGGTVATLGTVYKWNGTDASTAADKDDADLDTYLISIGTGTSGEGRTSGHLTFATAALTAGKKYWLGDAGAISLTRPQTAGDWIIYIGYSISTTELIVSINQDDLVLR